MMDWKKGTGFTFLGFGLASLWQWINGQLEVSGEFAANVVGATIGGTISVGLAVFMFNRERKIALQDRESEAAAQRSESIRQALRHIRAIKECILGGRAITINSSERILTSIIGASNLATVALSDQNLTDFPLRLSMTDAAQIGHQTAATLQAEMHRAALKDATIPVPAAEEICATAIGSLNRLIADYTAIRQLPSV